MANDPRTAYVGYKGYVKSPRRLPVRFPESLARAPSIPLLPHRCAFLLRLQTGRTRLAALSCFARGPAHTSVCGRSLQCCSPMLRRSPACGSPM
jgi:hypothetical protein